MYSVRMVATVSKEVAVEADSPEEAVKRVASSGLMVTQAVMRAESVELESYSFNVVGQCEACSVVLLDGRDSGRTVDEDGVMLCTPCCAKAEEDGESEPLQSAEDALGRGD